MAKQFQYSFVFKAGNVFTRGLLALGISFNGSALITEGDGSAVYFWNVGGTFVAPAGELLMLRVIAL